MNPHREKRRTLAMAIEALDGPIDNATGWDREHLLDLQERLSGLWSEAVDAEQCWESERPRREAEIRLAYHIENDTLDLY